MSTKPGEQPNVSPCRAHPISDPPPSILQNMSPHNNAALMTRSLQMRNSLLTAAQSANQPTNLLASQAAAAAMFNHQSASLFAAANIKSNAAVTGMWDSWIAWSRLLDATGDANLIQKCRKIHGLVSVNQTCTRARVTQPSPHIFLHICTVLLLFFTWTTQQSWVSRFDPILSTWQVPPPPTNSSRSTSASPSRPLT